MLHALKYESDKLRKYFFKTNLLKLGSLIDFEIVGRAKLYWQDLDKSIDDLDLFSRSGY